MAQMWPAFLLFATLLLGCNHASSLLPKYNNATDRHALLSFKSMLSDGSIGSLASWNDSIHFCEWPGITCAGRRHPQRVVSLVLSSLGLAGSISPAIGNLTFMRKMDLSSNQFYGPIPQEMGRLFRLQHLNLSQNSLEGGIPASLSSCLQLQKISMRDNMLTGNIPPGLSSCSDLQLISLSNNSLMGHIPPGLTNLSFLYVLDLDLNQLSGSIPPTIGNLCNLSSLRLAYNQLAGSIPSSIGKLSKLKELHLPSNLLTGTIPPSLWNLSSLSRLSLAENNLLGLLPSNVGQMLPLIEEIELYENQFHGPIPMSLSNASYLERIQLSRNNFSGIIPSNIGSLQNLEWLDLAYNLLEAKGVNSWSFLNNLTNCTNLQILQLDSNNLGGMLPNSISNLSTKLQFLNLGDNEISGNISPDIGNLGSLTELDLQSNFLTGSIPTSTGMLQHLNLLNLRRNKLSGEIPSTIGNLTQLIYLFLGNNKLSGIIPASLGNCQSIYFVNLESNDLTGGIPKEILTISTFYDALVLAFNSLTGSIPSEVGSLRNLRRLDFSMNKLSGKIPSSLGECQELEYLFLHGNLFHGDIPSSLSALIGIQYLDLSNNNLSGKIPEFFQDFHSLIHLNLSFNNFEGPVPREGIFPNTSAVSMIEDNNLCGGHPKMHLRSCPSQSPKKSPNKKHNYLWLTVSISISASLVVLLCILVACCRMHKSKREHLVTESISEQKMVSYAELLTATNGFSSGNLIGIGSFSRVYKGILHDDDSMQVVSVKVLNLQLQGATKSFIAECEALRNIRHRNLVKILTACSSVDFRGNEFKALVFEFMANGSLDDWLHPKDREGPKRKRLTFIQRLNIAIDVALALDYLHHYCEIPIIHCDLKPSNVLLDDDMTAHVGDFGIARILKKVASKSSKCSTNSIVLKGTIGYVPPEYGMANSVSTRGDVYSYGILLLEMFTSKRPTDDIFIEGLGLRKFVEMVFPQRVTDVIDVQLLSCVDGEETDDPQSTDGARAIERIASVLQIGILCSNEQPTERLEMGEVIRKLHKIRDVFLRN